MTKRLCSSVAAVLTALLVMVGTGISQKPPALLSALDGLSDSFQELTYRVSPAVVQIRVMGYAAQTGMVGSTGDLVTRARGSGSGVVLAPEGYIVTNAHVVAEARRIQVMLPEPWATEGGEASILRPRGRILGAQLVNLDRETDLAVLKVEGQDLPYLRLGDSDRLRQGQLVFAFGSPLGLENTVTMGVVSAVARQLRPDDPMIYVQTDAPINPGNSGGPLVNAQGEVVGINTLIYSQSGGSEGIGFAAPSNIVKTVYEQISKTGRVRRGEIGMHAQTLTPEFVGGLGLSQTWGVLLGDVHPGGPASRAGLKIGDLILSLDGKPMENGRQLQVNLYQRTIGQSVTLDVLRGSKRLSVRVVIAEREDDPDRFVEMVTPENNAVKELGILGIDLDRKLARMFPEIRRRTGVIVATRAADAPYTEAGLLPGDIIHALNGRNVENLSDLKRLLGDLAPYEPVVVQVERGGRYRYVAFQKE